MYSALFTLNTTTEVPLSKAPNPQLLPGRAPGVCSRCVCVFTAVCMQLGWVKCRAQIPSMGHHTWPHVTSLSLSFTHACTCMFPYIYMHGLIIAMHTLHVKKSHSACSQSLIKNNPNRLLCCLLLLHHFFVHFVYYFMQSKTLRSLSLHSNSPFPSHSFIPLQ